MIGLLGKEEACVRHCPAGDLQVKNRDFIRGRSFWKNEPDLSDHWTKIGLD
jgi:hypothetical protein